MPKLRATAEPENQPIGFISDTHGNLEALKAVLEIFRQREVKTIIAAGDHILGGDAPLETFRLLQQSGVRLVRGLSDTALATINPAVLKPISEEELARVKEFSKTREAIGDLIVEQLRRLPEKIRIPLIDGREILVVHGSPRDPYTDITFDMTEEEIIELLDDDPADIIVCGSCHVPFRVDLDEITIIGLGSVGAFREDRTAYYTIVTPHMSSLEIIQDFAAY